MLISLAAAAHLAQQLQFAHADARLQGAQLQVSLPSLCSTPDVDLSWE
jgi:hypothetical protein